MRLGEKIRLLRNRKFLTQAKLAEKADVSLNSLQKYESGESTPKIENITKIATALEIDINTLIEDTDYQKYVLNGSLIGNRIKSARLKKRWTQTDLAHKIDMSQSMVAAWERNDRKPKEKTLKRIADALEVPLKYFDITSMDNEFEEWIEDMITLDGSLPNLMDEIIRCLREADIEKRGKILKLLDYITTMPYSILDDLLKVCRFKELEAFLDDDLSH
ncbi:helix-turn-helix transcriptional regulator [Eubacterium sp. 1001713B170207_170306_E7]|uniref:helix-turn-helix domain-containing protein n=1 Tax=Eubacterium sp. 1001713B170207_170306_E7 TaxID=2787097 RepID=UPI0018984733|nr:helix-turn-helix transcriptional regulator [Eubacterium sp. 1001713B170207_170306_E7]